MSNMSNPETAASVETSESVTADKETVYLVAGEDLDGGEMMLLRTEAQGRLDAGADTVILDLSRTGFLSEEAVAALLGLQRAVRQRKASLFLALPSPAVRAKLTRMGILGFFSIRDSLK